MHYHLENHQRRDLKSVHGTAFRKMVNHDLISYYYDRAKEYEKIYLKSERQDDLQKASTLLQSLFSQKNVLEIACGTGYWTERIAETAHSIHATDINQSVIDIAGSKTYKGKVTFEVADFYHFTPAKKYDALFGGFIWSHILLQDLDRFIIRIKDFVVPGGTIVFMDNNYVEGSNHPIVKTDEQGNTYQERKLENGSMHSVLKNFPSEDFVTDKLSAVASEISFVHLPYYWMVSTRLWK